MYIIHENKVKMSGDMYFSYCFCVSVTCNMLKKLISQFIYRHRKSFFEGLQVFKLVINDFLGVEDNYLQIDVFQSNMYMSNLAWVQTYLLHIPI